MWWEYCRLVVSGPFAISLDDSEGFMRRYPENTLYITAMNALGEQGWEAISTLDPHVPGVFWVFFKRPRTR
jgi:hypothetical protein